MIENPDASSKNLKSESKKNKLRRRRNVVEKFQSELKKFDAIDVGLYIMHPRSICTMSLLYCVCIVLSDRTQHKNVVVGVSRYVLRRRLARAVRGFRHVRRPRPVCYILVPTWTCCLCYRRVHRERPLRWPVSRPAWHLELRRRYAPPRPRNSTTTRACIEYIDVYIYCSYTKLTLFKCFVDISSVYIKLYGWILA